MGKYKHMTKYTRIEVGKKMFETGIVPVFYDSDIEVSKKILECCYTAGIRVFEFTNRGDFGHVIYAELSKYVASNLKGMVLGVGSIMDAGTASLYVQLGANFVVSPIINEEIARVCNKRKVAWIPGCGTATEISFAQELGAEIIKIFPAIQVGGPDFVKAIRGPMPWTSIMATGGINANKDDIKQWFDAGVHCVGLGSKAFCKDKNGFYDYELSANILGQLITYIKENIRNV